MFIKETLNIKFKFIFHTTKNYSQIKSVIPLIPKLFT